MERHDIVPFQNPGFRNDYIGGKRRLGLERRPLAGIELAFKDLVEEQLCPAQVDVVLARDLDDDFRRIEQPVAVVLPESDVVDEILGDAGTDGEDAGDGTRRKPCRLVRDALCEVARRPHGAFQILTAADDMIHQPRPWS